MYVLPGYPSYRRGYPLGCRSTDTPRYATDFTAILAYSTLELPYRLVGHKVIGLSKRILNYALSCVWSDDPFIYGVYGGVYVP